MKTLYESIIQSRFGDHKIEESILDIDAPNRLENDVKAGIKRQKLIQEILKPVEDIIKMYHYSTQGNLSVMQDTDLYGLKGGVAWYEMTSEAPSIRDKKGVEHLQNILEKAYGKYKHENVDNSKSSTFPTSQFTFVDLGIAIFICFYRTEGTIIRLCYQSNNKQAGKYIRDLIDKYSVPF